HHPIISTPAHRASRTEKRTHNDFWCTKRPRAVGESTRHGTRHTVRRRVLDASDSGAIGPGVTPSPSGTPEEAARLKCALSPCMVALPPVSRYCWQSREEFRQRDGRTRRNGGSLLLYITSQHQWPSCIALRNRAE